jgi:hypothetical protein
MRPGNERGTNNAHETVDVADLIVRRIAKNLGVPVSSLTEDSALEPRQESASPGLVELRTLLNAFLRLEHPAARRRCIAMAEAEFGRQLKRESEHL